MQKPSKGFRRTLRILGILALVGYTLFIIGERAPLFHDASFMDISINLLFIFFLAGFLALWKYELISGVLLITWYVFEWCLGIWVWDDPDMVLIMGFPIFIIGILALIYGIRKRAALH